MNSLQAYPQDTPVRTRDLSELLPAIVSDEFGSHPFSRAMSKEHLEQVLPDYLAMSLAFRYLQAAAQKDAIFDAMRDNREIPTEIELTNAVANFLTWDESGGHELTAVHGKAGLPRILETSGWFHSGILRSDCRKILGHSISPRYSPATRRYLVGLYRGLASTDAVRRCAHMVAFEIHAGAMIDALWATVAAATGLPRAELEYFHLHMGGDDPAEKYHVDLTKELIRRVVPAREHTRFLTEFRTAYAQSFGWCQALADRTAAPREETAEIWHGGSCHCGGVRFEVRAPAMIRAVRCNCSICEKGGYLHLLVEPESFRLLGGEGLLTTYQFNERVAKHTFCSVCGTKPFYRPRSNPKGYSVNVHCLDRKTVLGLEVRDFDGQHWEESIGGLAHTNAAPPALGEYAEALRTTGSVMVPAGVVFTAEELARLEAIQSTIPEERVARGDTGDTHDAYVRRVMTDKPGELPTRVNRPASDDMMSILDAAERKAVFAKLFGSNDEYVLRRVQVNRMVTDSFVGPHLDVTSNPDFEFAVMVQLGREFRGGEFVVYSPEGGEQVFAPTHGSVLVTTCKFRHEVRKVLSGCRNAVVSFYAKHDGANRRAPSVEANGQMEAE